MYLDLVQYPLSVFNRWIGGWGEGVWPTLYFMLTPLLVCIPFSSSLYEDLRSGWSEQVGVRSGIRAYILAKMAACFAVGATVSTMPLLLNFYLCSLILPLVQPDASSGIFPLAAYHMWSELFYENAYMYTAAYITLIAVTGGLLSCFPLACTQVVRNRIVLTCSSFALCMGLLYLFAGEMIGTEAFVFLSPITFMQPYQPFHSGIGFAPIGAALCLLAIGELLAIRSFWRGKVDRGMYG